MTLRATILQAVATRLQEIQVANGYETNAGLALYVGELPQPSESDADAALALLVGDEEVTYRGEHAVIHLPIDIQGVVKLDVTNQWLVLEALLGDVKKAIEVADRTLGGLLKDKIGRGPTRTLPREAGSLVTGFGIGYVLPYADMWGNP